MRTKHSTVQSLKNKAAVQTPKAVYHAVNKDCGGVLTAFSISDLPRNCAQVKYQRRGHTNPKSFDHIDSLVILLEQFERQQLQRGWL